jgi:putative DNA-invertase from lambdoid prophage Rac
VPTNRKGLGRHLNPPTKRAAAARNTTPCPAPAGHVYGYARVSTLRQSDEGESLEVQQRTIAGYAQMHGLTVEKVFVERGVSGSRPLGDRPEGSQLLALLRPGDVVVTPKLDRMFRSALDALDVLGRLKDHGIALHMIDLGGDTTGNGVSKLVFTILSAVAEAERDRTRERIAEVKRDQRARGRFLGGAVPWAHRRTVDGRIEVDPDKKALLALARRLRGQRVSLRAIQAKLAERGETVSHVAIDRATRVAA